MDPRGGRGTLEDIVPTHIKFGVDPSTRWWDIAQKPLKCKNSPLTLISFPPFSAPLGALTPKRGGDIRNQSTPACKLWLESARGLSRNRWQKKRTNKKTYSKTNTSPFALASNERMAGNKQTDANTSPQNYHKLLILLLQMSTADCSISSVVARSSGTWLSLANNELYYTVSYSHSIAIMAIFFAISEILKVKLWHDLDWTYTTFYWSSL